MCRDNNERGFTLIEVMIALFLLSVTMVALLNFMGVYQRFNIENTMKNEAIRIAEARMDELRSRNFAVLANGAAPAETRIIRSIPVVYGVNWTVQTLTAGAANRAVQVDVSWKPISSGTGNTYLSGKTYSYNTQTILCQ